MASEEKQIISQAAALMGATLASFVRMAAMEKARAVLDCESGVTLSARDFSAFTTALDQAFSPNLALKSALTGARRKVRRA